MSTINVNAIDKESGSTLSLGTSGTTVDIPSGATFDVTGATVTGLSTSPYGANSCQMYRSGDQTMPNNTITLFTADSSHWDTHGSMANTTNNRIDIKTAGKYWVYATLWWDGSGASESRYVYIHWYDNSASTDTILNQWTWQQTSSASPTNTHTGVAADLAVDDYIYVKGFQNANSSVTTGGIHKSHFGVMRIE